MELAWAKCVLCVYTQRDKYTYTSLSLCLSLYLLSIYSVRKQRKTITIMTKTRQEGRTKRRYMTKKKVRKEMGQEGGRGEQREHRSEFSNLNCLSSFYSVNKMVIF